MSGAPQASSMHLLEILYQHVCVPPNLPGSYNVSEQLDREFFDRSIGACRAARERDTERYDTWDNLRRCLETSRTLNCRSKLDAKTTSDQFARLNLNDFVILRVTEQNAGLLIYRQGHGSNDNVLFDSFEAAPTSEQVLAADVLAMDFPTSSIAISFDTFSELQQNLAEFLEQANKETVPQFAAKSLKAGISSREVRDTTDPALITELLSIILEANGVRKNPLLLRKHVRDDVCWKNADRPWRRSPTWLILRVAIQSILTKSLGPELGRSYYKLFVAIFVANILSDLTLRMSPDPIAFTRNKLGRRIAKLNEDVKNSSPQARSILQSLLGRFERFLLTTLQNANRQIETAWSDFKRMTKKPVPRLSQTVDYGSLRLSLPNSGSDLDQIIREWQSRSFSPRENARSRSQVASSTKFSMFIEKYLTLANFEGHIRAQSNAVADAAEPYSDLAQSCIMLSSQMREYIDLAVDSYESDPVQKSQLILICFEIWVQLDRQATIVYPTLLEYHTGFSVEALEILVLPYIEDMKRLQIVEHYISYRNERCDNATNILGSPRRGCFAERYFECTPQLQSVLTSIESWASEQRAKRAADWQEKSAQYETYSTEIAGLSCIYAVDNDDFGRLTHSPRCPKCYKERCRNRLRVDIFEEPLPSEAAVAKAIVFELCCPPPLAAYRDSTWLISSVLGCANFAQKKAATPPKVVLRDYTPLKRWNQKSDSLVTLASSKKSFHQTHYSSLKLPVDLEELFKRSGLYFQYYDTINELWVERDSTPTFSHQCGFIIPPTSPYSALQLTTGVTEPSSYAIVASQAACPSNLTVNEYIAYQSLFSSRILRWHCILLELASSNLNFSEATTLLVSHLASQAGPNERGDCLRDFHVNFQDQTFCRQLLNQIHIRITNIRGNWREIYSMDMLLTLLLRLWSICQGGLESQPDTSSLLNSAVDLLDEARNITLEWIKLLHNESLQATSMESSQVVSRYAFWSAILCRRTFAVFLGTGSIPDNVLGAFVGTSITLRDNLPGDIFSQPHSLKSVLRRDVKLVFQLQPLLRAALSLNPGSFLVGLDLVWPQVDGAPQRSISSAGFLTGEDNDWFQVELMGTRWVHGHSLRFHLLQGILLVDGRPVGKLPQEHRKSPIVQRLFGTLNLRTATSSSPGMQYQILLPMYGHVIHLGMRNGSLVARANVAGTTLEYVPWEIFRGSLGCTFDLPAPLVDGCVHWLDLNSQTIEIRQESHKWQQKHSNWKLDLNTRCAERRQSILVDPNSFYFQQLAGAFRAFERSDQLIVFQKNQRIFCEIKRMSLSFTVNKPGLLHCHQYGSVDPNQDAGTWYGLASKLIFRDGFNPTKRFILVPTGLIHFKRHGVHVSVFVEGDGSYMAYTINDIVGRVDCPAEPVLVYAKAMFHALTSFSVPDPLTGRTGSEEAIDFLSSGICQPWAPLSFRQTGHFLAVLAQISPQRQYYPGDLKVMQTVNWNPDLPIALQHEAFRFIVDAIRQLSQNLATFALTPTDNLPELEPSGDQYLLARARVRRARYERSSFLRLPKDFPRVKEYDRREKQSTLLSRVYDIVSLIRQQSSYFETTNDLIRFLQRFPVIGGYDRTYDKALLSCFRVDFELEWGSLARFCRETSQSDNTKLMFFFALLLYAHPARRELVYALLAYSVVDDLKQISLPPWPSYINFHPNLTPTVEAFTHLIKPFRIPYEEQAVTNGTLLPNSRMRARLTGQRAYEMGVEKDAWALAEHLVRQWPAESLSFDGYSSNLIRVQDAANVLVPEWTRLIQNRHLLLHLQDVQRILNVHSADIRLSPTRHENQALDRFPERIRNREIRDLSGHLLRKEAHLPLNVPMAGRLDTFEKKRSRQSIYPSCSKPNSNINQNKAIQELRSIILRLHKAGSNVYLKYSEALCVSLDALTKTERGRVDQERHVDHSELDALIDIARRRVNKHFQSLCDSFTRDDTSAKWLQIAGMWPPTTTVTLLQLLRSGTLKTFGPNMKELLTEYALSITALQRLVRIDDALCRSDMDKVQGELRNDGHKNWNPLHMSDWLLFEIDSNILIRAGQVDVAFETISPRSGSNSVLQMNMGQGKTSCVIPMSAAVLANKKQLVRVVVPKALLLQTAQLLQSRLGGLVGRDVVHVPFARKTSTSLETTRLFASMHVKALKRGGVLLSLPEHMLSFSLSGLQRLTENRLPEARPIISTQNWLKKMCRDIMDESDYTLSCRTQLVYPSGSQVNYDGGSHRWETAELLLGFVRHHLWDLANRFKSSIEVVPRRGGYPIVYFLKENVRVELLKKLVDNICSGQFPLMPVRNCTLSERNTIRAFLSEGSVSARVLTRVSELFPDKPSVRNVLYLLRGLLVHRILLMALSRRWNVQYGLHPQRDPVAVPFTAKGVPSESAEWGHPDVCILFTILSFYYSGLSVEQVRQTLDNVIKSDDPASIYEAWISGILTVPDSMRDIFSVNPEDAVQIRELSVHLRFETQIIDYFLNTFVFPRHAKQFHRKLQASGWDLPLFTINREQKALTTGFSGTNDNRDMLPLNIKQHDLPSLAHTNAEVLTYLLQPRNMGYTLAAHEDGRRFTEVELLDWLSKQRIRILIDAGAQVLELDNRGLVQQWLQVDPKAPAAVYFDASNKAMVIYRNDCHVPLVASPFADNLGEALLYLDEAHTRGTDLKLPKYATAGLTLGLGQTKDTTVQAAMRCRDLATTQSVKWIGTPEVHQSILQIRPESSPRPIDSRDVVFWLLNNSCLNINQLQPLYYAQGVNFCERMQAFYNNRSFLDDESQRSSLVGVIQDKERMRLEELYCPRRKEQSVERIHTFIPELSQFRRELGALRKGFRDTGGTVHPSALQEVEQEREVAYEIEKVREVQKPMKYKALGFPGLHKDLLTFATTGRMFARSDAYEHALITLQRTGLRDKHTINIRSVKDTNLFCSIEFSRTVQEARKAPLHHLQRTVNWILWSPSSETAIIVIPEEAECLLPIIRDSKNSACVLLTYSAPTTRKMLAHFNNLDFYIVPALGAEWKAPRWLTISLGLMAGRLYFDFEEYHDILSFLGIQKIPQEQESDVTEVEVKELESTEGAEEMPHESEPAESASTFTSKPFMLLQDWLAIRRRGQDFTNTPMGFICQGKTLTADHPFFTDKRATDSKTRTVDVAPGRSSDDTMTAMNRSDAANQSDDDLFDIDDDDFDNDVIEDMEVEADEEDAVGDDSIEFDDGISSGEE